MSGPDHYLRNAELWAAAARDARTEADREACLNVEASFRALAETCRRLSESRNAAGEPA